MAISVVQKASAFSSAASSLAKAFTSNVTAGNLLVCVVSGNGAQTDLGVSDNINGSWTKAVDITSGSTGSDGQCAIFYKANAAAGATTVTASSGLTSADIHLHIFEVSGIVTTSPLDLTASANQNISANGNASATTSGSAAQASEYALFGTLSWNDGSQTFTAGTGYTHESTTNNSTGGDSVGTEDEIFTAASGTITATQKLTQAETVALSVLATFKGAGGGGNSVTGTATDTLSFSESLARTLALTRAVSDTESFSDTPARTTAATRTASDSVSFSDSATANRGVARSATDSFTFSESVTRSLALNPVVVDSFTFSDTAVKAAQAFTRAVSDSLTFSDVANGSAQTPNNNPTLKWVRFGLGIPLFP